MQSNKAVEKITNSKKRLAWNETDERRERSNKRNKPHRKRFEWEE